MFSKLCYGDDNDYINVNDKHHNDDDDDNTASVNDLNKKKNLLITIEIKISQKGASILLLLLAERRLRRRLKRSLHLKPLLYSALYNKEEYR